MTAFVKVVKNQVATQKKYYAIVMWFAEIIIT